MSIDNFINTLRVLAEGESQVDDPKLLPTDLFNNRTDVIDSLVDILNAVDNGDINEETIYDIFRYLITIDVRIGYRFDPEAVGEFTNDNQLMSAIGETYIQLNSIFSITQSELATALTEGTVSQEYSGITGAFIQAFESNYSDNLDLLEYLHALIRFHKEFCVGNPNGLSVWWADAIADVYNSRTELEDSAEMYDFTEDSVKDAVRNWYVENIPNVHRYWDNCSSVIQNVGPNNLITVLYEETQREMESLHNLASERAFMVDQPAEILLKKITTVEELFIDLLIE
jgi:hypothetical protein